MDHCPQFPRRIRPIQEGRKYTSFYVDLCILHPFELSFPKTESYLAAYVQHLQYSPCQNHSQRQQQQFNVKMGPVLGVPAQPYILNSFVLFAVSLRFVFHLLFQCGEWVQTTYGNIVSD